MDTLEFLTKGNISRNPNYNPTTKKGALQSPYVVDYIPGADATSKMMAPIVGAAMKENYNPNAIDVEKYREKGLFPNRYDTEESLNRELADTQGLLETFGNMTAQLFINEIGLGTIKGFSDLIDAGINLFNKNEEFDYTNPFSQALEEAQDAIRERYEIYEKNPGKGLQLLDSAWWANGLVSVGSSVALLMPALGETKLLSLAGTAAKGTKLAKAMKLDDGLAGVLKRVNSIKHPNVTAAKIENIAKSANMALVSRTAENYQEARSTYKELYADTLEKLNNLTPEQKEAYIEDSPMFAGKSNEEIAKTIAGIGANTVFKSDYAMLLMDVLEYRSLNKLFKGEFKVNPTLKTMRAAEIERLGLQSAETAATYASKNKFLTYLELGLKHPGQMLKNTALGIPFNEGIEEGYQAIAQLRAGELDDMLLDPDFKPIALTSYLRNPQVWDSAFFGIMAGTVFQGAMGKIQKGITKIKDNKTIKSATPETQEILRQKIKNDKVENLQWLNRTNTLIEELKDINDGYVPSMMANAYQTDVNGEFVLNEDNTKVRNTLTPEEQVTYKLRAINSYLADLTIKATDKGYYDLLEGFLTDENFTKYLKENGIDQTTLDTYLNKTFLNRVNNVHDLYLNNLDKTFNNIDFGEDKFASFGIKEVAKELTYRQLTIEGYNDTIADINAALENNDDYKKLSQNYLNDMRIQLLSVRFNQMLKQEEEYEKQYSDGLISKSALDDYKKQLNKLKYNIVTSVEELKQENALNDKLKDNFQKVSKYLSKKYTFSEEEKQNIDSITNETISNTLTELLNSFNEEEVALSSDTENLLTEKITAEYYRDEYQSQIPVEREDYQNLYDDMMVGFDSFVAKKYNKAYDTIANFIKNAENPQEAFNEVLRDFSNIDSKDAKTLKEAATVLRLGQERTKNYYIALRALAYGEESRRAKEAEKDKKTVVDGKVVEDPAPAPTPTPTPSTGEESKADIEGKEAEEEANKAAMMHDMESAQDYQSDFEESERIRRINIIAKLSNWMKDNVNKYISVINNIQTFDTSDDNYKLLRDAIYEDCKLNGLNDADTQQIVNTAFTSLLGMMKRIANTPYVNEKQVNNYKRLITALHNRLEAVKNDNGSFSLTKIETDKEVIDLLSRMITSYAEKRNIKDKNIDIEDFFDYLMNDEIPFEEIVSLFANIRDVLNKQNKFGDYKFVNLKTFQKHQRNIIDFYEYIKSNKLVEQNVTTNMHISAPNAKKQNDKYKVALERTRQGKGKLTIEIDPDSHNISIKNLGTEIGYLARVEVSQDGNELHAIKLGLQWKLKENNGTYSSNLDDLFLPLIDNDGSNTNINELFELCEKYRKRINASGKYTYNNGNVINLDSTDSESKRFAHIQELLKPFISNYNFGKNRNLTEKEKVEAVIKAIDDILFFGSKQDINPVLMKMQYYSWLERVYTNYKQTKELQDLVEQGKDIEVKIPNAGYEALNYSKENKDIDAKDYQQKNLIGEPENYVVLVDNSTGAVLSEVDVAEQAAFSPEEAILFGQGQMGIVVHKQGNRPFIAKFTESNKVVGTNVGIKIAQTLTDALTNYYNGKISFEKIRQVLIDLFGNKTNSSPLVYGTTVIEKNGMLFVKDLKTGTIAFSIYSKTKGNTGKPVRSMQVFKADNGKNQVIPNIDSTTGVAIGYNEFNPNYIAKAVNRVMPLLIFNRSAFTIKHREATYKDNEFFYKQDGKLYVMGEQYDNYFDYITKNKCFKTNVEKIDGKFTHTIEGNNSLFMSTDFKERPEFEIKSKQVYGEQANLTKALDIIKKATTKQAVSTKEVLKAMDISEDYLKILFDELGAIDDKLYYNKSVTSAYDAKFDEKTGHIIITSRGIAAITKNDFDLLRLITHENIHQKFNDLDADKKQQIVSDLLDTYRQWYNAIVTYKGDDADFNFCKRFIELNQFTPEDFRNGLDSDKFAEEWLCESLSRPQITNTLQKIGYDGEINKNTDKNLFQRILEAIIQLVNKAITKIQEGSILEKQISIFNDNISPSTNPEIHNIERTQEDAIIIENPVEGIDDSEIKPLFDDDGNLSDEGFSADDWGIGMYSDTVTPENNNNNINLSDTATPEVSEDMDNTMFEKIIEAYYKGEPINPNMFVSISNMDNFIKMFPNEIKPLIASAIKNNRLLIVCR